MAIDLLLPRSVIARADEVGNVLGWVRIDNDRKTLVVECRNVWRAASAAIEATYGWVRLEAPYDRRGARPRLRPVIAGR
jgi:hypothetical protein